MSDLHRQDWARDFFQAACDRAPDYDVPPTGGTYYLGDFCKVRGEGHVWNGEKWERLSDNPKYMIQVP